MEPRVVLADNPGPFTLDGTRTYLVGRGSVVVIDPGPDLPEHVDALQAAVADADEINILVTHDHADHSGAAPALSQRLGAPVLGSSRHADRRLGHGDTVLTDAGTLAIVEIPGHAPDHIAFHWLEAEALFVGDHMLGGGDTTWVGEYSGCVREYLASLERVEATKPTVIYPAHGPPIHDPRESVERFRAHRLQRIRQVRDTRAGREDADAASLVRVIYGDELPERLRQAAEASVSAMVEYLEGG